MAKPALQTFGKYQILDRIATGGMAEIYKARLEGIGGFQRTFAIKRILPNLSQNGDYIAMLVDEAKVAGLLSHANIVQILDLGQVDGVWYIAMEYVDGRDLGGVLRRAREKGLTLPVPHTVFITIELLKGLEYAHERQVMRGGRPVALNIIHRDVSPPNILLSVQGEVKLTDFGIARASLKAMETVSGIVKGRFDYMSPEQAAGSKDLDQRSDLFSVGVVLYEMLTGTHPFRTDNEIGTIEKVRTGDYTPVSQINPEVPFTLETIVDRALQVNRDDRYPSATAFKEALDKFFHDAGFIFTHATLASYVKGLFPEMQPNARGASQVPAQPRTVRNVSGSLVDDAPTGRNEHRTVPMEGRGSDDRSGPVPGMAPTALTPDDTATLIRQAPDGWEDEIATTTGPRPWSEDEQETAVAPAFGRPALDEDPSVPLTDASEDSEPWLGTGSSALPRAPTPVVAPPAAPLTATGGRRGLGLLGGGLIAVLMLVGGLFGGMLITIFLGLAAGIGLDGGAQATARRGAVVQVVAPTGTSIKLDGDAVGTQFAVPTDGRHRIEVHLDGHEPWSAEFSFSDGEYRVLHVETVELTPSEGR